MRISAALFLLVFLGAAPAQAQAGADVSQIADEWLEGYAAFDPLEARLWGVATSGGHLMGDNSAAARSVWMDRQRGWLAALLLVDAEGLDVRERAILIDLQGKLETAVAFEACRPELWPLNHVAGWHLNLVRSFEIAGEAAGETMDAETLRRWADDILRYLAREEKNLRTGLATGYSSPRSISLQVATQLDALVDPDSDLNQWVDLPPGELAAVWHNLMQTSVGPAFAEHARFIREDYAPLARTERSLSVLPNGGACYAANILRHTGIRMTGSHLLALSTQMSGRADQHLAEMGASLWDLTDSDAIRARLRNSADEPLGTEEAIIAIAQADSQRLIAASAPYFPPLPPNAVTIDVYPPTQRASMVANYRPNFEIGFAGVYFLNPQDPRMASARSSERVTSHEVAPGHHMQAMVGLNSGALGADPVHQILTVGLNNALVEGWAQYAEIFAAEEGLLAHPETGLRYWSEFGGGIPIEVNFNTGAASEAETARLVLERRGVPTDDLTAADPVLDWLAMMPAQVISYDLGADFIYRLRDRARAELGEAFDYPTFHRLILEEGSVPLWRLEDKVNAWIAEAG